MTEVLHSSPSMPISSVQQTMKRLVDEIDYSSNRAMHTSPVDLLAQYAMGSPLTKKPRLDRMSPLIVSEHGTPIKFDAHSEDSDVSPMKTSHNEFNRSFNDSHDESHLDDSRVESSLDESRDEDDDYSSTNARPFPCVWLNNDGSERSDSPAIVSVVPEPAGEDRAGEGSMDPIVVVPTASGLSSPTEEDGPFPCVWMNGDNIIRSHSRSPPPLVRCEPTMPVEKTYSSSLLKHGDAPIPDKFNFKSNGGAINILPTRMPMEAQSPPQPTMSQTGGLIPTMVTGAESDDQNMEVCPDCHKVFKRKVYLQRHMEREHWSTAKVFKCEDCAYETKHQSNLSVHRRIHTGERPYHCGLCGQRYTQGHLLKSHIRSKHGGNMEFYNLDKKSDSTRGRKSLDPKQEGKTNDKISTLLAQHAGMSPHSKMNPLLSSFMNGMAPFPLRPLMHQGMSPMGIPNISNLSNLPPNLMGGPRLFHMPGLPGSNPLLAPHISRGMSQAMQLPLPMPLPLNSIAGEHSPKSLGLKIPLKVPEMSPNRSFTKVKQEPALYLPRQEDDMAPEDLSIGRKTLSPDSGIRSPALPVGSSDNPMSGSPATPMERAESPEGTPIGRTTLDTPFSETYHFSTKSERVSSISDRSSVASDLHFTSDRMSIADRTVTQEMLLEASAMAGKMSMQYPFYNQALARGELMNMSPSPEPLTPTEKCYIPYNIDLKKSQKSAECHEHHDKCDVESCPHANKLRKLRKNIMRMLSVLSPELGVEGVLDYNTDEVDEMLHEVIYSNIEDDQPSSRKT